MFAVFKEVDHKQELEIFVCWWNASEAVSAEQRPPCEGQSSFLHFFHEL